jgi:hypothetical protein
MSLHPRPCKDATFLDTLGTTLLEPDPREHKVHVGAAALRCRLHQVTSHHSPGAASRVDDGASASGHPGRWEAALLLAVVCLSVATERDT